MLMEGKVNANLSLSRVFNGMEKKQSFISTTIMGQSAGKADKSGRPRWMGPMTFICSLKALRSCKSLHLPDFFLMIDIGVFHGEREGLIYPASNCSCTN